jgi:hypothetical protein
VPELRVTVILRARIISDCDREGSTMSVEGMATSFWARIDGACAIRHRWSDDTVSVTFQGPGRDTIGLEIDATGHGLDKLLAVLEEARSARPATGDDRRPVRRGD